MSADASEPADGPAIDAIDDPEAWRGLSRQEQSDALAAKHEEESRVHDDGIRDFDAIDDPTQQDTLDAIQQTLDSTWTAKCFEFTNETPTVPFAVAELTETQQDMVIERAALIAQVEELGEQDGIETADDIRAELDDDAAELFDDLDELDIWLNEFLEEITAGTTFTADWWADGENYPTGLRMELLSEVVVRYQSRSEAAQSFRQNRLR